MHVNSRWPSRSLVKIPSFENGGRKLWLPGPHGKARHTNWRATCSVKKFVDVFIANGVKEGRSSIPNGGNIESCGRCLYRKNVFSPIPRPIVIWIEGIAGFLTLWLQYLIGTELNKVSFSWRNVLMTLERSVTNVVADQFRQCIT